MAEHHCTGCGLACDSAWCPACGQRQPRAGDFSLRRLAGEAWEELTSSDSRLWRTVLGIFVPGRLTEAHLAHRWQLHLPPVRLFLVASGIYFLLAWEPYTSVNLQQVLSAPEGAVPPEVRSALADPRTADRMGDLTALLKFLFVVPMGLWMALLMWGNRMPVGAHMVFSLHYTTADFVLFSLAAPILAMASPEQAAARFQAIFWVVLLLLLAWAVLGVRRVYRRGWPSSLARGLAIVLMDMFLSALASQLALVYVLLVPR